MGRYFRLATGSCFFWESEGRDPGFYFWALPFLPVCFLPYLPRGVGTETTLSITRRLRKQLQWGLPHQPFPSFLGAGSSFYYPLGFDLQLQVAGGAAGALVSDLEVSHCAVSVHLRVNGGGVVTNRNSGQLRHLWACAPGGAPRLPAPPPQHTLLAKTRQMIHLLTRAEKQVKLGTLISPLLAGMVPAAAPSTPSPGEVYPC